jgi:hypothetical protein
VVLAALAFALPLVLARLIGAGERPARAWSVLPLALLGVTIWAAAIISPIAGIRWNEALFLFVPTDVALWWLSPDKRRRYARVRVGMVVVVSLLVAVGLFKQPLWVPSLMAFLPLLLNAFDLPARRRAPVAVTGTTAA